MTPQAQNKILKLLALRLLREIAADIRSSGCYKLLAEEDTNVSNIEQLVTCIRWVTTDLVVEKDFIGLMPLEKANAASIAAAIKDVTLRMVFPWKTPKPNVMTAVLLEILSKMGLQL